MDAGRTLDAATLNAQTVAWLDQVDRLLNDPKLLTIIQWYLARDITGIRASAPGYDVGAAVDNRLGQMRGAVVKVNDLKDAWNNASTGGQPLYRFISGLGG